MMPLPTPSAAAPALVDGHGRHINYLRLSVTDRCDFRCRYCMAEDMTFLPRNNRLSRDELVRLAGLFASQGVSKIRITGGEPLVRPDIVALCDDIARLPGVNELVLSTNGNRLSTLAKPLADAGVQRLNISLDSLDAERFTQMTRHGALQQVLDGIDAVRDAGFTRIRLNCVMLRGHNDHELLAMVDYALGRQLDLCFIEEMPLGDVGRDRAADYLSSDEIIRRVQQHYTLQPCDDNSGGPARYLRVAGYPDSRIGVISPLSNNFCGACNRIRVTAEGRLLLCLGHENSLCLRTLLRAHPDQDTPVIDAIYQALTHKPQRHHFDHPGEQLVRFMNATGG